MDSSGEKDVVLDRREKRIKKTLNPFKLIIYIPNVTHQFYMDVFLIGLTLTVKTQ